jgi:uncharacterized lipoprotein YddW (UPF0748 family)
MCRLVASLVSAVVAALALVSCSTPEVAPQTSASNTPSRWQLTPTTDAPPLQREFRAAWVATVANIDWPSKPGLNVQQMKDEIEAHVKAARAIGLNALLLQVRTNADALYPSKLEPWAEWLTGVQGQAPMDGNAAFDPLQEWIDQAHRAGIELHVWFNPYRAAHTAAKSPPAATHVSQTRPQWVKRYGGFGWLDPGEPGAADHSLAVMRDVVQRYDIDGIHIDDYFYPYPVNTTASTATGTATVRVDFPDDPSWAAFQAANPNNKLSRADWRREQVNQFVARMDAQTRAAKPWVRVGISPFGLGKPALRPSAIRGFSQYDDLYADVELWQQRGQMDYLAPQLYWPIAQKAQAFDVLLDYWIAQNTAQRHVFAGLYSSRINNTTSTWQASEITAQIEITRKAAAKTPQASGHIHFSMVALTQNRLGLADALKPLYAQPAIAPVHPRVPADAPVAQPRCELSGDAVWAVGTDVKAWHFWSRQPGAAWTHRSQRVSQPMTVEQKRAVERQNMRIGGDMVVFEPNSEWAEDAYGRVVDACAGKAGE